MLKTISASVIALAVAGLAGSAMAGQITNQSYGVDVNIQVVPIVSLWGFDDIVNLTLSGADGNNHAGFEDTFARINNVTAAISVTASQGAGPLLEPGINFFIFNNVSNAQAQADLQGNAYSHPSAVVWNSASLGTTKPFMSNIPVDLDGNVQNITYVANQPGGVSLPQTFNLDVVWTIAPQ